MHDLVIFILLWYTVYLIPLHWDWGVYACWSWILFQPDSGLSVTGETGAMCLSWARICQCYTIAWPILKEPAVTGSLLPLLFIVQSLVVPLVWKTSYWSLSRATEVVSPHALIWLTVGTHLYWVIVLWEMSLTHTVASVLMSWGISTGSLDIYFKKKAF